MSDGDGTVAYDSWEEMLADQDRLVRQSLERIRPDQWAITYGDTIVDASQLGATGAVFGRVLTVEEACAAERNERGQRRAKHQGVWPPNDEQAVAEAVARVFEARERGWVHATWFSSEGNLGSGTIHLSDCMPCPRTIYDYALWHEGQVESEDMADELFGIYQAIFDQVRSSASGTGDQPWFWDLWTDLNNRFHTDGQRLARVYPGESHDSAVPAFEPFVFSTVAGPVALAMEPLNPLGVEKACLILTDPRTGDATRLRHDAGVKHIVRQVIELVETIQRGC